jgi:hypothetical protein
MMRNLLTVNKVIHLPSDDDNPIPQDPPIVFKAPPMIALKAFKTEDPKAKIRGTKRLTKEEKIWHHVFQKRADPPVASKAFENGVMIKRCKNKEPVVPHMPVASKAFKNENQVKRLKYEEQVESAEDAEIWHCVKATTTGLSLDNKLKAALQNIV